jgi:CRP/FNR family cyclic AMP-dependent transcriptional regulator
MAVNTDMELLRAIPLFVGVADPHLQLISFSSQPVYFRKGDWIIRKGEAGDAAYLLLTGHANIYIGNEAEGLPVASASLGALVGEMAMIAPISHPVSVFAASDIKAKRIPRSLFQRLSEEFPDFSRVILANMSTKLDSAVDGLIRLEQHLAKA